MYICDHVEERTLWIESTNGWNIFDVLEVDATLISDTTWRKKDHNVHDHLIGAWASCYAELYDSFIVDVRFIFFSMHERDVRS